MRLRGEVVDLLRARLLDDADQVGRVGHVAVVHEEAHALLVGVDVEVVDALGVEGARAALHAVDDVALLEQQLGEVGAVLAGDAGDQGLRPRDAAAHQVSAHRCSLPLMAAVSARARGTMSRCAQGPPRAAPSGSSRGRAGARRP